jgi:hypothetical protein
MPEYYAVNIEYIKAITVNKKGIKKIHPITLKVTLFLLRPIFINNKAIKVIKTNTILFILYPSTNSLLNNKLLLQPPYINYFEFLTISNS